MKPTPGSLRRTLGYTLTALLLGALSGTCQAGDPFKGKDIYEKYCTNCHGAKGEGLMMGAPNFSRGEGLFVSDDRLVDVLLNGKNVMPSFRGRLDDEQLRDVIAYLRTLF